MVILKQYKILKLLFIVTLFATLNISILHVNAEENNKKEETKVNKEVKDAIYNAQLANEKSNKEIKRYTLEELNQLHNDGKLAFKYNENMHKYYVYITKKNNQISIQEISRNYAIKLGYIQPTKNEIKHYSEKVKADTNANYNLGKDIRKEKSNFISDNIWYLIGILISIFLIIILFLYKPNKKLENKLDKKG